MTKYVAPNSTEEAFTCPHCEVLTTQEWHRLVIAQQTPGAPLASIQEVTHITRSTCFNCDEHTYWLDDQMLYPPAGTAPMPSADLPESCDPDYMEARAIVSQSPRSAAALLRQVIQRLCGELGESGTNINNDIAAMARKGKINARTQRALDIVRVVGNESVHPGAIDLNDDRQLANTLFRLVNQIVLEAVSTDKEINSIYEQLPPDKLKGIENRDKSS